MPKVPEYNLPKFPARQPVIVRKTSPSQRKQAKRRVKHNRLLRLFDGDGYEEFHTPKYVFVKQWNGNTKVWQVAIYPIESWRKKAKYNEQKAHLRQIMLED